MTFSKKKSVLKTRSIFFLVIFTSFLLTPVCIQILNKDVDVITFFSMTEEENHDKNKTDNQIKTNVEKDSGLEKSSYFFLSALINSRYLSSWDNIYFDTTSPPPEHTVFAS